MARTRHLILDIDITFGRTAKQDLYQHKTRPKNDRTMAGVGVSTHSHICMLSDTTKEWNKRHTTSFCSLSSTPSRQETKDPHTSIYDTNARRRQDGDGYRWTRLNIMTRGLVTDMNRQGSWQDQYFRVHLLFNRRRFLGIWRVGFRCRCR